MRTFLDTVYVIALVNERGQHHERAVELAEMYDGQPLLITDAVLLEVGNALARGYKRQAAEIIEVLLASHDVEVVYMTTDLFARAFHLYKTFQDKEWSLVDCISFVVMRDSGVMQALTSDKHFVQAGFAALMRED